MKTTPLLSLVFSLLLVSALASAADVPTEIGGFKLGEDITEHPEVEGANYLREVVVNDWHGFRKGIISYGTCAHPGLIVKMRMKYDDSSKHFYDELLKRFKDKFGSPDVWKGDAFGILYVWKWRFVDEQNRRVNLILQHNLHNDDENIGNLVKLSYPEWEEEERLCFIKFCEDNKSQEQGAQLEQRMKPDWDYMIPR